MTDRVPSTVALTREYLLFGIDGADHSLETVGGEAICACACCKRWKRHIKSGGDHGQPLYLLPTMELVTTLARWLWQLQGQEETSIKVLECGAGDGTLSAALQDAISRQTPAAATTAPQIVATDSGARGLAAASGAAVHRYDVLEALAHFMPDLVIVGFMPLGVDWTAGFRACASVRAYLLLGEVDDGCCGRPWATWGYLCDDDQDAVAMTVSSTSGSSDDEEDEYDANHRDETLGNGDGIQAKSRAVQSGDGWRRVYSYEPDRTPWGQEGWVRADACTAIGIPPESLIGCTDVCWSTKHHVQAVLFRKNSICK